MTRFVVDASALLDMAAEGIEVAEDLARSAEGLVEVASIAGASVAVISARVSAVALQG